MLVALGIEMRPCVHGQVNVSILDSQAVQIELLGEIREPAATQPVLTPFLTGTRMRINDRREDTRPQELPRTNGAGEMGR